MVIALGLIVASYLVGAIPFGYLIGRIKGVNLFQTGSGNIGATNVARTLGRPYGVLTFLLDGLKGAGPVAVIGPLAQTWDPGLVSELGPSDLLPVGAALASFLGHLYPIYLGFRGGKGVATGAGAVAVLMPLPTLFAALAWVVLVLSSRYVSLASIGAAILLVLARIAEAPTLTGPGGATTAFALAAVFLVIVKHRENVRRLHQGTESTIGGGEKRETLLRALHIMALGIWFGGAAFFNFIAAPSIFATFPVVVAETPSDRTAQQRIIPADVDQPTRDALASALAGSAVGPIFPKYFLLQAVCGLVALITATSWYREGTLHRWRAYLITLAVLLVAVGWPLSAHVSEIRLLRFSANPEIAAAAKLAFGPWHLVSLFLSLITTVLAGVALALTARLPSIPSSHSKTP